MGEKVWKGTILSEGIAIGKVFFLVQEAGLKTDFLVSDVDVEQEIFRYREALAKSRQDVKRLQKQLESEAVVDAVLILEAELEMLRDPLMTIEMEERIRQSRKNAAVVFGEALLGLKQKFKRIREPFFTERFQEFQDLGKRILSYLQTQENTQFLNLHAESIVCAHQLSAMDAASVKNAFVGAFVTEVGGAASHAAIVARARNIPFVAGIDLFSLRMHPDTLWIVDGLHGKVIQDPSEKTLLKYQQLQAEWMGVVKQREKMGALPAETLDGCSIHLLANLNGVEDAEKVRERGGHGIGLLRSEYLFLPDGREPSEQVQFLAYQSVLQALNGEPVVIRTFDLRGDKLALLCSWKEEKTPNGWLKRQLRAIARASSFGNLRVLFPMIANVRQFVENKQLLEETCKELCITKKIPVGCMIEVPSAALLADHLAEEADFFSIGTNDLVHYALAVDRGDTSPIPIPQLDPSLVRMLSMIVREAKKAQIPVCLCGEIAGEPRLIPLLLGLGIEEFSVSLPRLSAVKEAIRSIRREEGMDLARQALYLKSEEEILKLLDAYTHKAFGAVTCNTI